MTRSVIEPGAVIGILGDGQLGRMTALAAASLGYKVAVLGPGGCESPAGQVAYWAEPWAADGSIENGHFDEFCERVSVVLVEWENVPVELVQRIEARDIRVCASSHVLAVAQDRLAEKQLAIACGIRTAEFISVDANHPSLHSSCDTILKTRRNGYDGKGQIRLAAGSRCVDSAWHQLGKVPCILEEVVPFVFEMSMIIVRGVHGASVVYGPFENEHHDGILRRTRFPPCVHISADRFETIYEKAAQATKRIAEALNLDGILAVEFFVTEDGGLIFNEMAPRPHNSGHLTIECYATSQFEQYVRAACNLPFGSMHQRARGEMRNLIGRDVEDWQKFVSYEDGKLHLYGKNVTKPGRKMGHVTMVYVD